MNRAFLEGMSSILNLAPETRERVEHRKDGSVTIKVPSFKKGGLVFSDVENTLPQCDTLYAASMRNTLHDASIKMAIAALSQDGSRIYQDGRKVMQAAARVAGRSVVKDLQESRRDLNQKRKNLLPLEPSRRT
ncbi:MAG: hypothetical protein HQL76_11390 [Magnetococcales bacterium]|nr:hypothetical protein [Magnetococcales bacterium]